MIDALLAEVEAYVLYVISIVGQWFIDLATQLATWVSNLIDQVMAAVHFLVSKVADAFLALTVQIQTYFQVLIDTISNVYTQVLEKILAVTTVVVDSIRQYANSVFNEIRVAVSWLLSTIQSWFDAAIGAVIGLINQGLDAVSDTAAAIHEAVVSAVEASVQAGEKLALEVSERISDAYEELLVGPKAILASLEERLGSLRESFGEAAATLVQGLTDLDDSTFKPIRESVVSFLTGIAGDDSGPDRDSLMHELTMLTSGEVSATQLRERWRTLWDLTSPRSAFWTNIMTSIGFTVSIIPAMLQIAGMVAQPAAQEFAREYPFQLFGPNEATAAWRRGLISEGAAVENIRRLGYSIDNAKELLKSSSQVPPAVDILSMWHRELIPEERLSKALHQLGLSDDWQANVKAASFLIPPVQDLITMAVREVFSPEIVEEFGQLQEFPESFSSWTEKQGLSDFWARNYWAAHWALPSVNQAFEMFHRGVIDEPKLRLLLRALDVMPGWVEPLIKIAFRPFTRVDIRRMHKLDTLSDAEVQHAYKDLGYDEDKSKALLDFTIALNGPKNLDDDIELGKLSRSTILGFYSDGLVSAPRAMELLEGIGHTADAARLYVESADSDEERRERKAETDLILQQVQAGGLTFEEGQTRLMSLGLETVEQEKAIARLVRILAQKTKIPSRSEGEAMLVAGVIPMSEYQDLLERLGYGPKWAKAYQAMAQRKLDGTTKRG